MDEERGTRLAQYAGVGCLTFVGGFFSGGMLGVLVGKIVGMAQRCTPTDGFPICNFWPYFVSGFVIGAITLPALTLWRLRQNARARAGNSK